MTPYLRPDELSRRLRQNRYNALQFSRALDPPFQDLVDEIAPHGGVVFSRFSSGLFRAMFAMKELGLGPINFVDAVLLA